MNQIIQNLSRKALPKVENKPLDSLVLNLLPVSNSNNEKQKPALEIPNLAERIKIPSDKLAEYEKWNGQMESMGELHAIMAAGYDLGEWRYDKEEKFIWELPHTHFAERLTKEELLMLYMSLSYSPNSDVEKFRDEDPDAFFFRKVYLSYHHTNFCATWNSAVKAYNALKDISFPELGKDFQVKFDTPRYTNKRGYAKALRHIFLDAEIGILLYFKGTHVLTISVDFAQDYKCPDKQIVRIAQIQCAKKNGNRWLYRLPSHFIPYFAKQLYTIFTRHNFAVQFIKPGAVVNNIREMYYSKYLWSKEEWEKIRKMRPEWYKEQYGDEAHKLYRYDTLKGWEAVIAEFDNNIFRMLNLYSRRIPGLRRINCNRPDYYTLAPTG